MQIASDAIEALNLDGLEVPVYKITNLRIINATESEDKKVVEEKVFLFQFDFYFFHQLHEIVGQFEVLKALIPDIRAVFVQQNVNCKNEEFFRAVSDISYGDTGPKAVGKETHKYFEGLVDLYKKDAISTEVHNLRLGNYLFKEAYVFFEGGLPLYSERPHGELSHKNDLLRAHGHTPYWQEPDYMKSYLDKNHRYYSWHLPAMRAYKSRVDSWISENNDLPKKIYISRRDVKARYEHLVSTQESAESKRFFKSRLFDESEFLEPYFESKGYTVITFQGMPLHDQLTHIKNATHIAGLVGSGFCNMVACRPGAKVYEIHVWPDYWIDYAYLSDMAGAENIKVILKDCNNDPVEMTRKLEESGV